MSEYRDVAEMLKAHEGRREALARLPFAEKIRIVERLQRLSKAIPKFPPVKSSGQTPARLDTASSTERD